LIRYGTNYTVADLLYSGTASDAFDLDPGYYMAVALGITPEGKVSGLYNVSEVFEVKEQIPTEEYKAWIGDWTIAGENGVNMNVGGDSDGYFYDVEDGNYGIAGF
jgi:hypothetical protein